MNCNLWRKLVNPLSEHHPLSVWVYNPVFRKYDFSKFESAMKKKEKKWLNITIFIMDDTKIPLQLWNILDYISGVDNACCKMLYFENQKNPNYIADSCDYYLSVAVRKK